MVSFFNEATGKICRKNACNILLEQVLKYVLSEKSPDPVDRKNYEIHKQSSLMFFLWFVIKATPHKDCASDAPSDFFVRLHKNFAGILTYPKGTSFGRMSRNFCVR